MKKKENNDFNEEKSTVNETAKQAQTKPTNKEKRLDQRRQIEELLEEKRLRKYTEEYDYYFEEM